MAWNYKYRDAIISVLIDTRAKQSSENENNVLSLYYEFYGL